MRVFIVVMLTLFSGCAFAPRESAVIIEYRQQAPAPSDDPTIVWVVNKSKYFYQVEVDGSDRIEIRPGERQKVPLDVGEHILHVQAWAQTQFGRRGLPEEEKKITIDPKGRSQTINLD